MNTFTIILISVIFSLVYVKARVTSYENLEEEWEAFKVKHNKKYDDPEEEAIRKVVFSERLYQIVKHNKLYARDLSTYSMTVNKFSDLTQEEMRKHKGLRKRSNGVQSIRNVKFVPEAGPTVPDEFDWRDEGAVTDVKDQGSCGSGWAFSAVGALEGQHFRRTGKLVQLSEQNLIDCSSQEENEGCDGGDPTDAFNYVYENDGIDNEKFYPYTGVQGTCHYNLSSNETSIKFFGFVDEGNEDYLQTAVATIGPISVDIYADDSFTNYESGVYFNECCEDTPNHSVLVVGYGYTKEIKFWVVKNSWGEDWGETGYVKMARDKDNNCGIASAASFPIT